MERPICSNASNVPRTASGVVQVQSAPLQQMNNGPDHSEPDRNEPHRSEPDRNEYTPGTTNEHQDHTDEVN